MIKKWHQEHWHYQFKFPDSFLTFSTYYIYCNIFNESVFSFSICSNNEQCFNTTGFLFCEVNKAKEKKEI